MSQFRNNLIQHIKKIRDLPVTNYCHFNQIQWHCQHILYMVCFTVLSTTQKEQFYIRRIYIGRLQIIKKEKFNKNLPKDRASINNKSSDFMHIWNLLLVFYEHQRVPK